MNDKLTEQQKADAFEKWYNEQAFLEDAEHKEYMRQAFHAGAEEERARVVDLIDNHGGFTDDAGHNCHYDDQLKGYITARATDNSTGV